MQVEFILFTVGFQCVYILAKSQYLIVVFTLFFLRAQNLKEVIIALL